MMKYKKQLKERINKIYPHLKIGKIKRDGISFLILVDKSAHNLKQVEQHLREDLSMPGLRVKIQGECNA